MNVGCVTLLPILSSKFVWDLITVLFCCSASFEIIFPELLEGSIVQISLLKVIVGGGGGGVWVVCVFM